MHTGLKEKERKKNKNQPSIHQPLTENLWAVLFSITNGGARMYTYPWYTAHSITLYNDESVLCILSQYTTTTLQTCLVPLPCLWLYQLIWASHPTRNLDVC